MEELLTQEQFNDAITTNNIVLIDFFAPWCGPCRMLTPMLSNINVTKFKVNIDNFPDLAAKFNITTIPTVIIFNDGIIVETIIGVKPINVYQEIIDKL